jgi:glycerol-3-phosphate O-acyltransferase
MDKSSWLFEVTPLLGDKIMSNINKATVVSSTSLFASSISGLDKNKISLDKVFNRIEFLKKVVEVSEYSKLVKLPELNSREIVEKMEKLKFISSNSKNRILMKANDKKSLEFYKNNVLHLLILQSFIFYKSRKAITKESLLEKIKEVLPQLRKDFFLDMPFQDNNEKILLVLEGLINLDLLKIDKMNMISWNQNEEEHDVAKMFSTIWLENLPS